VSRDQSESFRAIVALSPSGAAERKKAQKVQGSLASLTLAETRFDRLDELKEELVSHSPKVEAFRCVDIVGGPWLPRQRGRRAHYCDSLLWAGNYKTTTKQQKCMRNNCNCDGMRSDARPQIV
jgi:hypothetical protein